MRFTLKDYQAASTTSILKALRAASAERDDDPSAHWAVSLSAPTGAGKTVIASAVIETLFDGSGEFVGDPDARVLWVTDDPSLNEQTRRKMLLAADTLTPSRLRTIESDFDLETFDAQTVNFLNIQKLAKTTRLSRGDSERRTWSLWDTIDNTIRQHGSTFYVVIDEAHRGMKTESDRSTIVSRIVNGEVGVRSAAPIVWGISATPQRFNDAMDRGSIDRTIKNVKVAVDDVRDSGLLKDLVILDNPERSQYEGDTTLVRAAVDQTLEFEESWRAYSAAQHEPPVVPVLVVQVANSPTDADLSELLATILGSWPSLSASNIVNTFGERSALTIGKHVVKYMPPQEIQDDDDVRVVLCKDAISTGWDCPRAEVLVSLRRAEDYTYIAQLIGRMVRTPLARRIPTDQSLNTVNCYLPRFDKAQVKDIVDRFAAGKSDEPPVEAIVDPVRVWRNPDLPGEVFDIVESLPSYVVPGRAFRTQVARLYSLGSLLSGDGIVERAIDQVTTLLIASIDAQRQLKESDGELGRAVAQIRSLKVERSYALLSARTLGDLPSKATYEMVLDDNNVDDLFRVAHRRFPEGLSKAYWSKVLDDQAVADYDPNGAKALVAALALFPDVVESVEASAEQQVRSWLRSQQGAISALADARKVLYEPVRREARNSELTEIVLPESRVERDAAQRWDRHLLCDETLLYPAALKSWEEQVLKTELLSPLTVGWYRNPTGGERSLRIPYPLDEVDKPMYPDFVFLTRLEDGPVEASIVDPHGDYLADMLPKLRGLASYAEAHGSEYRRIESVVADGDTGQFLALDLKSDAVRRAIRGLSDKSVISLFKKFGGTYG